MARDFKLGARTFVFQVDARGLPGGEGFVDTDHVHHLALPGLVLALEQIEIDLGAPGEVLRLAFLAAECGKLGMQPIEAAGGILFCLRHAARGGVACGFGGVEAVPGAKAQKAIRREVEPDAGAVLAKGAARCQRRQKARALHPCAGDVALFLGLGAQDVERSRGGITKRQVRQPGDVVKWAVGHGVEFGKGGGLGLLLSGKGRADLGELLAQDMKVGAVRDPRAHVRP